MSVPVPFPFWTGQLPSKQRKRELHPLPLDIDTHLHILVSSSLFQLSINYQTSVTDRVSHWIFGIDITFPNNFSFLQRVCSLVPLLQECIAQSSDYLDHSRVQHPHLKQNKEKTSTIIIARICCALVHVQDKGVLGARRFLHHPLIVANHQSTHSRAATKDLRQSRCFTMMPPRQMTEQVSLSDGFPTTSSSTKRTAAGKPKVKKYYAVQVGKVPGVYEVWADCQHQITGHKGAICKPCAFQIDLLLPLC